MPRLCLFVLFLVLPLSQSNALAADRPITRQQFAEAFNQLEKELPDLKPEWDAFGYVPRNAKVRVLELLGKPDEIEVDFAFRQTWKYGTNGPGTCPTLGAVTFQAKFEINWISGTGQPPEEGLFSERVMRTYLQAIWEVRDHRGKPQNPRDIIRAVNLLQPLGKEKTLMVIREYLRVTGDHIQEEGALIVLRAIFDNPCELLSEGKSQADYLRKVVNNSSLVVLTIEGIPYVFDLRGSFAGAPLTALDVLPFYEEHGAIRATPLTPSNTPIQDLDRYLQQYPVLFEKTQFGSILEPQRFQEQALILMETVYHAPLSPFSTRLPWGKDEEIQKRRQLIIDEASNVNLVWNRKILRYTFPNGTILPPREPEIDVPDFWLPDEQDRKLIVEIQRWDVFVIYVSVRPEVTEPESKSDFHIEIYGVEEKDNPEAQISLAQNYTNSGRDGKQTSTKKAILEEGKPIRIKLTIGNKTYTSPVFKP